MHDHESFRNIHDNTIFLSCFCYCETCYSHDAFYEEGNGCVCRDCFCRGESAHAHERRLHPSYYREEFVGKSIETVIRDLPENPGKTGTCRKCKAPTYRNGDRGRFPVLCTSCK